MANPINPHALPFRIDLLYVCRPCGRIYGDVESTIPDAAPSRRRQHCDCPPSKLVDRHPHSQVPEAVILCRCCGRQVLLDGPRRSVWFCRSCCTAIQTINRACGMFVIPIGRHTLLEPVGIDEDDGREVPAFVRALGDWFERIERLERHAELVVRRNLQLSCDELPIREMALDQYLERLPVSIELLHTSVLDLGRKFDVPPYLLSDAVRAIR